MEFKITDQPINEQEVIDLVRSPHCGGLSVFVGTVRNQTKGKKVISLEFEAYEAMAMNKMREIAEQAQKRWKTDKIAIYHRVGKLSVEETAVVIAVSTPHRKESFQACEYLIDTLKQVVPIWKKEIYEDGEIWVAAHP
ncbi:molybdenum cofactor biosynthesis protein MoaE [Microscilla marina]|uniref:Molybdopterin synthase catalytic subunit n=1 Tax=Microscilla marina ATCC 23134 TaxID=313606 RepID=A1ZKS9_MICM2|nr:molybdenum cofactor biosynthesis protein MoaE [Microscilla marina]EAY28894.1 molybdopterin converting factor, subunit 2 [Microscilla marina ATCC 23134]